MTRHDVANLVVRIFALWLGVIGVAALSAVPSMAQAPGQPESLLTALALGVRLPVGCVVAGRAQAVRDRLRSIR